MFKELLTRLRFLLVRKPHREVDEELQFHLERQTEVNIAAGMTPQEARRQAMIAFGGVERAREQSHEQRPGYFIETLLQRHPLRHPWLPPQSGLHHHHRRDPDAWHRSYHCGLQRGRSHSLRPFPTHTQIVLFR